MNEMVSQQLKFLSLVLLALLSLANSGMAAQLEVSLDREQITLGETAVLEVVIRDGEPQSNPGLTAVPGLTIQAGSRQNQTSIINGRSSSAVIFSYPLLPSREGVFIIPPVQIRLDNKVVASKSLTLRVSKDPNASANANKTAFIRLALSKTNLVVGEVISAELQLFVVDGRNLQQPQLTGDGFLVQKLVQPSKTRTRSGNSIFNVLTYKIALSATKAGRLDVGPFSCSLEIPERRNARRGDPNDPFTDFFGPSVTWREVVLTTDPAVVDVAPVPSTEGLPNFTGAIGQFTMRMQAGPTNVNAGDPITLRIEWQGQGNLDAISLPALNLPGFKSYPPMATTKSQDPLGMEGSRFFEQVLIPESSDIKTIPSLALSYLDPITRKFVVLSNAAVPISVKGSPLAANSANAAANATTPSPAPPPKAVFAHILPDPGTLTRLNPVAHKTSWFWVANALPPLLCFGSLFMLGYRRKLAADPQRAAAQEARRQWHRQRTLLSHAVAAADTQAFLHAAMPVVEAILQQGNDLNEKDRSTAEELRDSAQAALYGSATLSRNLGTDLAFLEKQLKDHPQMLRSIVVKTLAAVVLLWSTLAGRAGGEATTQLFQQANHHYEVGQYQEALTVYRQLIDEQGESFPILFNAGNAAFQSGSNGWALAYYSAAAQLKPRDASLRANYEFLGKKLQGQLAPLPRLSVQEQALLFACLNAACFACLFLKRAAPQPKTGLMLVSVGTMVGMLLMGYDWFGRTPRAVIIVNEAPVRNGPLEESQTAFSAKDGAVLNVLKTRPGWIQVQDQAGLVGWARDGLAHRLP